MKIIPAVDIMKGKVVRLRQGQFDKAEIYSENPILVAKKWEEAGSGLLHVVDLDGARLGRPVSLETVADIVKNTRLDIELGGGLRSVENIEKAFAAGVHFAVIGTSAVEDEAFCRRLIDSFDDKIIFAVDVKHGRVAVRGWEKISDIRVDDYVKKLEASGAKKMIYTDISRDGMMTGPNLDVLRSILKATSLEVTASGGISNIEDIKVLKALEKEGLRGIIAGKALYEGTLDLREAIGIG